MNNYKDCISLKYHRYAPLRKEVKYEKYTAFLQKEVTNTLISVGASGP